MGLKPGAKPADLLEACTAQSFALRSFDIHRPCPARGVHPPVGGSPDSHGIAKLRDRPMMSHILLVALRDFRQILATRGFG